MKRLYYCILLFFILPQICFAKDVYIIGSQNINYFPHYHFESDTDKGFAWSLLEAFARQQGISFSYQSFPIKRLQRELQKGTIDFVFPDNARWHSEADQQKIYSVGFITTTSGTIITRNKLGRGISEFKSLALPFGFTPVKWQGIDGFEKIRKIATPDAISALKMVVLGRVDGADVEYNVMQYARKSIDPEYTLVMDKSLPYSEVEFQLSTIKSGHLIESLNLFIQNQKHLVNALRQEYNIVLPQEVN